MYTTMYTTMTTTFYSYAYSYAVPGYVTASNLSQGNHAVSFNNGNPANVTPMPTFNMMVRATGNVIVPVELMRFVVE